MRQIFLSYARADLEHATKLYHELQCDPAVHVWFDKVDLIAGIRWRPTIRKAIRESSHFVALFSRQSTTGRGFRHTELSQALEIVKEFPDDTVYLIPVRIEQCNPPREEVADYNIADLFPDWAGGVDRIRSAVGIKFTAPAKAKVPRKTSTQKGRSRAADTKTENDLFRVKLVSLDVRVAELKRVATALNRVQSYFHLSHAVATPSRPALTEIENEPQLDLDRLQPMFYAQFGTMKLDYALCITDRFISFEEDGERLWNYLDASTTDERIQVLSIRGLGEHAANAGVSFERALAYGIVSDLASYFLDLDYHEATRGCPLDFVADHGLLVKGLKKRKFCAQCSRTLATNPSLELAFNAMLVW